MREAAPPPAAASWRTLEIRAIHAAVRGDERSIAVIEADPQLASDFALVLVPMVATSSLRLEVAERFAMRAGSASCGAGAGGGAAGRAR